MKINCFIILLFFSIRIFAQDVILFEEDSKYAFNVNSTYMSFSSELEGDISFLYIQDRSIALSLERKLKDTNTKLSTMIVDFSYTDSYVF